MKKIIISIWVFLIVIALVASVLHFIGIVKCGLNVTIAYGILCFIAYVMTVYAAIKGSNKNIIDIVKEIITSD